ncbi:MAG TPA: PilT/PilU family type 4a pilus ATPase, partial [bacterium]|nr:PilT/PilU family type 4a pilus ATPase [bacterium]
MTVDMTSLLARALAKGASDLHLAVGVPPSLRINGEIIFMDYPALTGEMTRQLTYSLLSPEHIRRLEKEREIDLSVFLPGIGRCRVNVYHSRGFVESAFRIIPLEIRSLEELGLPEVVKELAMRPKGLVLVAGPAGMGKTTTLAAMIDFINEHKRCRIVTIEDPIEYLHQHKKSIVVQREVGVDPTSDTRSFASALRHALRQDPNIICVGEMRDLDTFAVAMTAAETGHLVMGTIHTVNTIHTITRI